MCLAFPGKIVKILKDQRATADFGGVKKEINISLVDVEIGEYVIVHAGFAIEKIGRKEAKEVLKDYGK